MIKIAQDRSKCPKSARWLPLSVLGQIIGPLLLSWIYKIKLKLKTKLSPSSPFTTAHLDRELRVQRGERKSESGGSWESKKDEKRDSVPIDPLFIFSSFFAVSFLVINNKSWAWHRMSHRTLVQRNAVFFAPKLGLFSSAS